MTDGRKFSGYVEWSKKWFKEGSQFPDCLIDPSKFAPHYMGSSFSIYTEIIPVPYHNGVFISDSKSRIDMSIDSIKAVKPQSLKYGDVSGELAPISDSNFALIKNKKLIAHRSYTEEVCETIILSYNPSYPQAILDEVPIDLHAESNWDLCLVKDIVCIEVCAENEK